MQSFAFDVSERCCAFTEFSRRLNGIENLTVKRGDLYAPAGNRTFDRILAHPPYVPSLRTTQLFRDGGEDGERLTRRVVEGLPNYLHPGGRLYLLAMLPEYADDPIPRRIRSWLRDGEREFDMVVVLRRSIDAGAFLFDNLRAGRSAGVAPVCGSAADSRVSLCQRDCGTASRAGGSCSLSSARRVNGYTIADAERALQQADRFNDTDWVMTLRPRAVAGTAWTTQARLENGRWVDPHHVLSRSSPFRLETPVPDWAPALLACCDGTRTVAELGQPDHVRWLIGNGLLEVE